MSYAIEQKGSRCDFCGRPIDMSSGDRLTTSEFELRRTVDLPDDHEFSD